MASINQSSIIYSLERTYKTCIQAGAPRHENYCALLLVTYSDPCVYSGTAVELIAAEVSRNIIPTRRRRRRRRRTLRGIFRAAFVSLQGLKVCTHILASFKLNQLQINNRTANIDVRFIDQVSVNLSKSNRLYAYSRYLSRLCKPTAGLYCVVCNGSFTPDAGALNCGTVPRRTAPHVNAFTLGTFPYALHCNAVSGGAAPYGERTFKSVYLGGGLEGRACVHCI